MANLLEIAELTCRAIYPNPTPSQITMFVRSSITEYAAAMWIYSKEEEATGGEFEMPSGLLTEVELDVVDGEVDVSELNILNSLSHDRWLQRVGDGCYIKSSLNKERKLEDDDSIGDLKTYYVQGKKIKFPKGVNGKKISIVYANMGEGLKPDHIECNEYVASKVREKLMALYGNKFPTDKTINNNPDQ